MKRNTRFSATPTLASPLKNFTRHCAPLLGVAAVALLAGCASMQTPAASANLESRSGSQVKGYVTFTPITTGLRVSAEVSGLSPGEHGFHVHEVGDCSAADATSAKGHFNPAGKPHGAHSDAAHHVGDMPNLVADSYGNARYTADLDGLTLAGETGIVGRAVIVHADPDDYKSQPAGNAGKRLACGVIGKS